MRLLKFTPDFDISRNLVLKILLILGTFALIFTGVVAFIRAHNAYDNLLKQHDQVAVKIHHHFSDTLLKNAYENNTATLEGITHIIASAYDNLSYLSITGYQDSNTELFNIHKGIPGNHIRSFFLYYTAFDSLASPQSYVELNIHSQVPTLSAFLHQKIATYYLNIGIIVFPLFMIFYLMIYFVLIRHINLSAAFTAGFRSSNPGEKLTLNRECMGNPEDALGRLESGINSMHSEIIGFVSQQLQDITDLKITEKALKEREEIYRTLVENMSDGLLLTDENDNILFVNRRACDIYGLDPEEIMGKPGYEVLAHPDDRHLVISQTHQRIQGNSGNYQMRGIRKDGSMIWVRINAAPYHAADGTIIGTVGLIKDITGEKIAKQEQLIKKELEQQMQLARKSLEFKQNFLANMSHEIRTPLSGILGVSDLLTKTRLDETQADYVRILQVSGENLRGIINDVLDFSKIEAGKLELRKKIISLKDICDYTKSLYKNMIPEKVVLICKIDEDIPRYIEADPVRLNQVICNLFSNAIKFTEQGSITLRASLVERHPQSGTVKLKISISDTGIGISAEMQQKLFTPFFQAEDHDIKKNYGTGLGLSISKSLVEMHGGEIGVESTSGKGSTFWFTLVVRVDSVDHLQKGDTIGGLKAELPCGLNILLVEDNRINQKVFSVTLKYMGHRVSVANNGKEAVETITKNRYDLVLMDIQMPVMDGIEATRLLKLNHTHLPPIVGLSANAFEGDREKYMSQGLDEYLTKPLRIDDFNEVLAKFFN